MIKKLYLLLLLSMILCSIEAMAIIAPVHSESGISSNNPYWLNATTNFIMPIQYNNSQQFFGNQFRVCQDLSCKYQCFDDTCIRNAINDACNNGGAQVDIEKGLYSINSIIHVPCPIIISGIGNQTILKNNNSVQILFNISSGNGYVIIEKIHFDGNSYSGQSMAGVDSIIRGGYDPAIPSQRNFITVRDCYFSNISYYAINFDNMDFSIIKNNFFKNNNYSSIRLHSTDYAEVIGNYFQSWDSNNPDLYWNTITIDGRNNLVSHNIFLLNGTNQKGVLFTTDEPSRASNNIISDNIFKCQFKQCAQGIGVEGSTVSNIVISNNVFENLTVGVGLANPSNTISGNLFTNCSRGIQLATKSFFTSIIGNTFDNVTNEAIRLYSVNYTTVIGNTFKNGNNGYYEQDKSDYNFILGNTMLNNKGVGITRVGRNTNYAYNTGYKMFEISTSNPIIINNTQGVSPGNISYKHGTYQGCWLNIIGGVIIGTNCTAST
jgi:hypothetical protein